MSFVSLEFIGFVLATFILYYLFPRKIRWIILLVSSYIFYFLSSKSLIVFLLLSTLSIYFGTLLISKINDKEINKDLDKEEKKKIKLKRKKQKKLVLLLVILINLGVLAVLKYNNFFGGIINSIFNTNIAVKYFILPLGISYYTLQALGYIIDVYNNKYKPSKNIFKVALFLSFFPQMVEGPIGRFNTLADQLYEGHKFDYDRTISALVLIGWGFFKKLVIADRAGLYVNNVFGGNYSGFIVLFAIILYTIQIYTEFSGCMDIVCGLGELFGVKLDKNFRQPFFAKSINEFWRRWHITLGTWLRDYIFYPISLSKANLKLSKWARSLKWKHLGQFIIIAFPLFFVWFCNGLWHGPSLKYIIYGLYYYVLMMLGVLFSPLLKKIVDILKIKTDVFSYRLFQMLRTFVIVVIGLTIFRADTLTKAFCYLKSIFVIGKHQSITQMNLGLTVPDILVLIVACIILFVVSFMQEKDIDIREKIKNENLLFRWFIYFFIIFSIIIFGIYGPGYDASSFIYASF